MRPFHLILGPKWNKKSLTWRLNNFTPDLANSVVRYVSLSGQYGSQILDTDYEKKPGKIEIITRKSEIQVHFDFSCNHFNFSRQYFENVK